MTRGIPGEGYVTDTAAGPVFRVPLPKPPGATRAPVRERRLPPNWSRLRRADQEAWKREARAAMLDTRANDNPENGVAQKAETVGVYLTRWLAEQPAHLAPNTIAGRSAAIRLYLMPLLGDVPLTELTPRRVEAAVRAIERAPAYVREIRKTLVTALNDAVRLELLTRNPAALARGPRRPTIERPRLDAAQVARLVAAAGDERLGPLLLVAGALGLRRGELLGLRWADVDLEGASLRVAVQRQREVGRGMVERAPKMDSRRVIPLPASVVTALRDHADRQRFERQQLGYLDHGLVFCSTLGHPIGPGVVDTLRRRVLERAGLPTMRLHDLRGSAATILLALGVPLPAVMAILGHKRAATTLESYATALPADLADAARRMDAALSMGTSMGSPGA